MYWGLGGCFKNVSTIKEYKMVTFVSEIGEKFTTNENGVAALRLAVMKLGSLDGAYISDLVIKDTGFIHNFYKTAFNCCKFENASLHHCRFSDCLFANCIFEGENPWLDKDGIQIINGEPPKIPQQPTNEEIEKKIKAKVYSLPNKNFVQRQRLRRPAQSLRTHSGW